MARPLENPEYCYCKYKQHHNPDIAHIHFLGADALPFGTDIRLRDGDQMNVFFEGFGRPLRNPIKSAKNEKK